MSRLREVRNFFITLGLYLFIIFAFVQRVWWMEALAGALLMAFGVLCAMVYSMYSSIRLELFKLQLFHLSHPSIPIPLPTTAEKYSQAIATVKRIDNVMENTSALRPWWFLAAMDIICAAVAYMSGAWVAASIWLLGTYIEQRAYYIREKLGPFVPPEFKEGELLWTRSEEV